MGSVHLGIRKSVMGLIAVAAFMGSTACAGPVGVTADYWNESAPTTVAVLPVMNETTDLDGPIKFRELMEAKLAAKGYTVLPREKVDEILINNFDVDPEQGGQIMSADPVELIKELGVDAVVYGTVVDWNKRLLYAYNEIKVTGRFEMLTRDGAQLWTVEKCTEAIRQFNDPRKAEAAANTAAMLLTGYESLAEKVVNRSFDSMPDYSAELARARGASVGASAEAEAAGEPAEVTPGM